MKGNMKGRKELGLYIHIPFCVKKCDYCDFLSAPATENTIEQYFEALLKEIESYRNRNDSYRVPTIFFGGGTPSAVDEHYIIRVMELLRNVFNIAEEELEATIEINPGTVSKDKLLAYKKAGINRLSFGLQSADYQELRLLGRIHSYEQFVDNYYLARELGFDNINVDLMSALPKQTLASWETTLNAVLQLNPEHISAYSLIIEEGTKFYDRYRDGAVDASLLPDEDTDRLIYHKTKELLEANGYRRYEISNYARPGKECRHNSSYWIGTDYLGIGLGASSLLDGARFSNMHDINQYIRLCNAVNSKHISRNENELPSIKEIKIEDDPLGIRIDVKQLSKEQRMEEFMFLGLRMCAGVSKNNFFLRFGILIEEVYGEAIKELGSKKLLISEGDILRLTDYGIDVSNYVLSVFLLN